MDGTPQYLVHSFVFSHCRCPAMHASISAQLSTSEQSQTSYAQCDTPFRWQGRMSGLIWDVKTRDSGSMWCRRLHNPRGRQLRPCGSTALYCQTFTMSAAATSEFRQIQLLACCRGLSLTVSAGISVFAKQLLFRRGVAHQNRWKLQSTRAKLLLQKVRLQAWQLLRAQPPIANTH